MLRRKLVTALLVTVLVMLSAWMGSHSQFLQSNAGNRDSIQYWATGRLLVNHQNPYDPVSVLRLEQSQGYREQRPLMFRVPPWALIALAPVGLLDAYWAWFLTISLSIAALVFSTRICWALFGAQSVKASDCYLASYLFAPVLACLGAGQIGIFLLLGILLFLRWQNTRPFLAGAALLLPLAKPHLFAAFGAVCFCWIIARRRWVTLVGFVAAVASSLVAASWFDPNAFVHYRSMLNQQSIENEFIPALSGMLRLLVARQVFWVQFVPLLMGLAWGLWFWLKHRNEWSWREHGVVVLLVSVIVAPYSWLTDEVVLLPVVFQAAVRLFSARMSGKSAATANVLVALNCVLLVMVMVHVPLPSGAYVWSGLLWAAWYSLSKRIGNHGLGIQARADCINRLCGEDEVPSGAKARIL